MTFVHLCATAALLAALMPAAAFAGEGPTGASQPAAAVKQGEESLDGESGDILRVTGTMTEDGVECPLLRAEDGMEYALLGEIGSLKAGEKVTVEGELAEMSFCMQGQPLSVKRIEKAQ